MYTHLQVQSSFSFYESTIKINELVKHAKELGYKRLALTDRNLHGAIQFYKQCLAEAIQPIIGLKQAIVYEDDAYTLTLIARNNRGFQNLSQLSSIAQVNERALKLEEIKQFSQGISVLYTLETNEALETRFISHVKAIFKTHFYLTITAQMSTQLIERLKTSSEQLIVSNDVRFLKKADMISYEALRSIEQGEKWTSRSSYEKYESSYLKTAEEMQAYFPYFKDAFKNNQDLSRSCQLKLDLLDDVLPRYDVPGQGSANTYLNDMCKQGLIERSLADSQQAKERMRYELSIIKELGFSDYFLIVSDIVRYAKENQISVGPGRGSAAGSLVAYLLNITDVNPLTYNLLFERFLNPERVSMPDIDLDFSDERREEVIQYIAQKYGEEKVAQIITFGTYGPRSLLNDLFKVFEISSVDKTYILKNVHKGITRVKDIFDNNPEFASYIKSSDRLKTVFNVAYRLDGIARYTSTHAAGVIISHKPLMDHIPLAKGTKDMQLTQYPMQELEALGYIKFDILGLSNLTFIEKIIKHIKKQGKVIDFDSINQTDEKTFGLLQNGLTNGIFQLESRGMKETLKKLKPTHFLDIVAISALYRPGPMDQIETYIARKNKELAIDYLHPDLEPILKETYGILVYQEQIMQVAHRIAHFSLGEADLLRRAVSKKEHKLMNQMKEKFITGCVTNGYSHQVGEEIFSWIVKFANYGFNKSHSVAYSKITYLLSYLKANYPQAFFIELLSQAVNNQEKLLAYLDEAKALGIKILPPDINQSFSKFTVQNNSIRIGLQTIKGIGYQTTQAIIDARDRPFKDLFDFCLRTSRKQINKSTIESLIRAGTFDSTYKNRASLLASLDQALSQADLFGDIEKQGNRLSKNLNLKPNYTEVEEFLPMKKLEDEKDLLGFFVSPHPLEVYRTDLALKDFATLKTVSEMPVKKQLNAVVIIQEIKQIKTKRNETMAFLELSDETSELEAVLFPNLYRQVSKQLEENALLKVTLQVSERNGVKQYILEKLSKIELSELEKLSHEKVYLKLPERSEEALVYLNELAQKNPGNAPIIIHYERERKTYRLSKAHWIDPTEDLVEKIKSKFGDENVVIKI